MNSEFKSTINLPLFCTRRKFNLMFWLFIRSAFGFCSPFYYDWYILTIPGFVLWNICCNIFGKTSADKDQRLTADRIDSKSDTHDVHLISTQPPPQINSQSKTSTWTLFQNRLWLLAYVKWQQMTTGYCHAYKLNFKHRHCVGMRLEV